ncbi:hypothetical protein PoB_002762400 [Plakobranchus ocellatus]|uniref:Uncharacterized protein n=1 Tax=Plakobranchus ocellatus TaxID=259542 RepID=A0AAV4A3B5_9GAST|nr:hypothetical protein PoB_002762400 [Plakobranchus ocellatus]
MLSKIVKTGGGGGGPAEPMDKMSEKVFDLIPNQFVAIGSELVDAFAPFLTSFVLQLLRHSSTSMKGVHQKACAVNEDEEMLHVSDEHLSCSDDEDREERDDAVACEDKRGLKTT